MKIQILIFEQQKKKNKATAWNQQAIEQMIFNAWKGTTNLKNAISAKELRNLFFRESTLNPNIECKTPSTAKGIAQINRATAFDLGWVNWEKEWMNPQKSIAFGTLLLDKLAGDFLAADGLVISERSGFPPICILHLFYQWPGYRFTILKSLRSGDDDQWKKRAQIEKDFFFSDQSI